MKKANYYIPIFLGMSVIAISVFFVYQNTLLSRLTGSVREAEGQKHPGEPEGNQEDALLPDLQVEKLSGAYILPDQGGRRNLRFPGTFTNAGDGPLELVGTFDEESGAVQTTQIIYKKDGTRNERLAGNFVFHPEHDHWHFEDFVEFEIWNLKGAGELDQKLLGTGKMTFCIHDYAPLPEELPGKPDAITYPLCGDSAGIQGISVGWQDTYLADVPGQEIDITSLADGNYAFRAVVDPENRIIEKDESNNFSITYIEIEEFSISILPGPPVQEEGQK